MFLPCFRFIYSWLIHFLKIPWIFLTNKHGRASIKFVDNFLGNTRRPDSKDIVQNLFKHFKNLGYNKSTKLYFSYSHIDYYMHNLSTVSKEQHERFHQNIKEMEKMDCEHGGRLLSDAQARRHLCVKLQKEKKKEKFHPSVEVSYRWQ